MPSKTRASGGRKANHSDLTGRVREALSAIPGVEEKRMFGSVGFIVNGKLCISARESRIMCRVDPNLWGDLVARTGCRPVKMKGREYKSWVYVDGKALTTGRDLKFWVGLALDFNATLTSG